MNIHLMPVLLAFGIGIALVTVILALEGYTPFPSEPPTHQVPDYQNSIVTIKRTSCYGYCPDYLLTVYGNGTVLYEGRQFVRIRGNYTYSIPNENVSKLVDAFYDAEFFSMPDLYSGCIDCPVNIASLSVNGITKSVEYGSLFESSEKLRTLDRNINELSGSNQYVRCPPKGLCEK